MTHVSEQHLLVHDAARALSNQADTILAGYITALNTRDRYHRNLANRRAQQKRDTRMASIFWALNSMMRPRFSRVAVVVAAAGFWTAVASYIGPILT